MTYVYTCLLANVEWRWGSELRNLQNFKSNVVTDKFYNPPSDFKVRRTHVMQHKVQRPTPIPHAVQQLNQFASLPEQSR